MQTKDLWTILSHAGLTQGEKGEEVLESPWYIKVLLALSGWIGALFLLVFMALILGLIFAGFFKERYLENFFFLASIGAGFLFFSYVMFKSKTSEFFEHFFFVISLVGQVFVIAAFFFFFEEHTNEKLFLFMALFQAFLVWLMPNYIHRMLSSFFMALSFSYFFFDIHEPYLFLALLTAVVTWLWMNEFEFKSIKKVQAIGYGLLFALIGLQYPYLYGYEVFDLYYHRGGMELSRVIPTVVTLISSLSLGYVVWKILQREELLGNVKIVTLSLVAVVLLAFISFYAVGLMLGIIFLLIGFANSHRLFMGLGVVSSLFFISNYYYFLGETLMDKAIVLGLVGGVLLLMRFALKWFLFKEVKDA